MAATVYGPWWSEAVAEVTEMVRGLAERREVHGLRVAGRSWCGGSYVRASVRPDRVTCPACQVAQLDDAFGPL